MFIAFWYHITCNWPANNLALRLISCQVGEANYTERIISVLHYTIYKLLSHKVSEGINVISCTCHVYCYTREVSPILIANQGNYLK